MGENVSSPYLADKSWARESQGRDIKVQGQTEILGSSCDGLNNMQDDVWLTVQSDGHWQQHPKLSPHERILPLLGFTWLLLNGLSPNFSLLLWSETFWQVILLLKLIWVSFCFHALRTLTHMSRKLGSQIMEKGSIRYNRKKYQLWREDWQGEVPNSDPAHIGELGSLQGEKVKQES